MSKRVQPAGKIQNPPNCCPKPKTADITGFYTAHHGVILIAAVSGGEGADAIMEVTHSFSSTVNHKIGQRAREDVVYDSFTSSWIHHGHVINPLKHTTE
ncbi:hypothetical protein I4U23_012857 [Adineta vaga]|nr:hypothetical protein I4U23_012857 [Adineta vaga]